jgi:transposase
MINEVANIEFDIKNLFETQEPPFTDLKYIPNKDFLTYVWLGWLIIAYKSELASSIIYKYLSQKYSEFAELSTDESRHAELLQIVLDKTVTNFEKIDLVTFEQLLLNEYQQLSSVEQLTIFLVEELSLLVPAALLYKQSKSSTKKKFLKLFLKDESRHIRAIFRRFQQAALEADVIDKQKAFTIFCHKINNRLNFSIIPVSYFICKYVSNDSLQAKILKSIYTSEWHQNHKNVLGNRYYDIGKILDPNLTKEQFLDLTKDYALHKDSLFDLIIETVYNNCVEHSVAAV